MGEVRMSLAEASERLGIAVNSVRSRWKTGKLRGERDNSGKVWVWLETGAEPVAPAVSKPSKRRSKPSTETENAREIKRLTAELDAAREKLEMSESHVADLRAHLEDLRRLLPAPGAGRAGRVAWFRRLLDR